MADEYNLDQGETALVYTATRPGDAVYLNVTSGSITYGPNEQFARLGPTIEPDDRGDVTATLDGEELWLHGEENGTVVRVQRQGWTLSLFNREIISVQNKTGTNLNTDINAQSVGDVETQQNLNPSEQLVIDSSSPTSTVSAPGTENVNLGPSAGEGVWELRAVYANIQDTGGGTNHQLDIGIENFNGELVTGEANGTSRLEFNRSEWAEADVRALPSDGGAQAMSFRDLRLDPTNNVNFTYNNLSGSDNTDVREYYIVARKIDQ